MGKVGINDKAEFIGQLIDVIEDFLEDRGITLPNPEKEDCDEDAAIIYGSDYGDLQTGFEHVLSAWNLLEEEVP